MNPRVGAVRQSIGALVSGSVTVYQETKRMVSMVFSRASGSYRAYMSRTRFDYQGEADPATNSIVVASVSWIARNFPDAPVMVTRTNGVGETEVIRRGESGAGAFLRLMERPNAYHDGPLLWKATLLDYLVGDAYWFKVRNGSGRVTAYWWLPRGSMKAYPDPRDATRFIGFYTYSTSDGDYLVDADDVVHFQNGISARDQRRGISVYESLYREVFTDDQGSNMTAALMRNLGVPGVTIAPSNTSSGPGRTIKDPEDVKRTFMEKFGGDSIGEPMVFKSAMEVKVISWSPEQMNLRDLRRVPEERISAVLGVPAGVAGLGAGLDRNTFSNYGEARQAGYQEGIIPLQRTIAAALEIQALPDFEDTTDPRFDWDVAFDWTKARAMQESVDAIWKRHTDAATKGLETRAQWKRGVGLPVDASGSDDVYVLPSNYVTVPVDDPLALAPGNAKVVGPALPPGPPTRPPNGQAAIAASSG